MGDRDGEAGDLVWRALSDPTRRTILDLLRDGAKTTGELSAAFEVTRYAVMKHLEVLREAGLITVERRGRRRFNHLNPVPIQRIVRRWIGPFEARAAERVLCLEDHLGKNRNDEEENS